MGFWLYCKPPIECCSASVYSLSHAAQFGYGVTGGDAPPGTMGAKMFPLHGHVHAVSAQHDWIYLVENWGISSDGGLWNWDTGTGVHLVDAGPWESLSSMGPASCLGIKGGSLWIVGQAADPFLGVSGSVGGYTDGTAGGPLSIFLDSGISKNVEDLILFDSYNVELPDRFRMPVIGSVARLESPASLAADTSYPDYLTAESRYAYRHTTGRGEAVLSVTVKDGAVWFVGITSGGSGYTPKCTVVFDPPGAGAEAVLDENGSVVFLRITGGGGQYAVPPTVTILPDGNAGSGFGGVALVEGHPLLSVDSPGSGYTTSFHPDDGWWFYRGDDSSIKALCTAPPPADAYVGQLYLPTLLSPGAGYFAPSPPTVDIVGGGGKGATATATLDANANLVSVQITNGGSGYFRKTGGDVKVPDPPSVRLSPGGATAVANVGGTNWSVTSITITHYGSQQYLVPSSPTVCVTHSVGTGGKVVAEVDGLGRVSSVRITHPGSGYVSHGEVYDSSVPVLTFSLPFAGYTGSQAATGRCLSVAPDRYRERVLWSCHPSPGGVDSIDVDVPIVTGIDQPLIDGQSGKIHASEKVFRGADRHIEFHIDDRGFYDPPPAPTPDPNAPPGPFADYQATYNIEIASLEGHYLAAVAAINTAIAARSERYRLAIAGGPYPASEASRVASLASALAANTSQQEHDRSVLNDAYGEKHDVYVAASAADSEACTSELAGKTDVCERAAITSKHLATAATLGHAIARDRVLRDRMLWRTSFNSRKARVEITKTFELLRLSLAATEGSRASSLQAVLSADMKVLKNAIENARKMRDDGGDAAFVARRIAMDSYSPYRANWSDEGSFWAKWLEPSASQWSLANYHRVAFGAWTKPFQTYSSSGHQESTGLNLSVGVRRPIWSPLDDTGTNVADPTDGMYITDVNVGRMYKRTGNAWVEYTLEEPPGIVMNFGAKVSLGWGGAASSFSGSIDGVQVVVSDKRTCVTGFCTVADFYTVSYPDKTANRAYPPTPEVTERRKTIDHDSTIGIGLAYPDALLPDGLCEALEYRHSPYDWSLAHGGGGWVLGDGLVPYAPPLRYVKTAAFEVDQTVGPFVVTNIVFRNADPERGGTFSGDLSETVEIQKRYRSLAAILGPAKTIVWTPHQYGITPPTEIGAGAPFDTSPLGEGYYPDPIEPVCSYTCRLEYSWYDYAVHDGGQWRAPQTTRAVDLALNDAALAKALAKKTACRSAELVRFNKNIARLSAGRAADLLYWTDTYWKGASESERKAEYAKDTNDLWDDRVSMENQTNLERLAGIDSAYAAEAVSLATARKAVDGYWDSVGEYPGLLYRNDRAYSPFTPRSLPMGKVISALVDPRDSNRDISDEFESFGRTLDKKSVVGRANAVVTDGLLTGFTVSQNGYGYQTIPVLGISPGMRKIADDCSSVSYGGGTSFAVIGGKVFWWKESVVSSPMVGIGHSVRVDSTKVAGEYPQNQPWNSIITVGKPSDGAGLSGLSAPQPARYEYGGTYSIGVQRANVTGNYHMSHGYSADSPPTVSGHDYDGGNWLGLTAATVGPTGAKSVSCRAGLLEVLCTDGSLWAIHAECAGFGDRLTYGYWGPVLTNSPTTCTHIGHPNNVAGSESIEGVSFSATSTSISAESGSGSMRTLPATGSVGSAVTSWLYMATISDFGKCYSSAVQLHSSVSHVNTETASTTTDQVGAKCHIGGGDLVFKSHTGSSNTSTTAPVTWIDGEAGFSPVAVTSGGMVLVQPSVVQSSTVPQFWVEDPSGKGSGASYRVTKLSPGDMLSYSGGWNRMGKKDDTFETVAACSTLRYHSPIGVSKSVGVLSDIRPGSSSNSPPSFQSITSVATDYLGLFPTANDSEDGSLWVTDGFTKRQQSPIEIKLTSFGNDLTCPPLVEIASPDGAAKAVAVLNGKVIAVGVDAAGLGYSVAPSIEFTAIGKGSGAKATAHIRGLLTSITVDAEGTKYNTRPKVRLTNHVCPSGDIGEATASLKSGYVVSASVTGSGEGYEVPPSAFGASQQFSTTIKGFVKSVSVTDGGSYLSCPEVAISGAVAVAFLEPHKAESGRYAVATVEVTDGGSAYSTPPSVTFSGGGDDATQATGVSVLNAGVDTIFTVGIAATDLSEVPIIHFLGGGATASCVCEFGVGPVTVTKEGLYWSSPDVEFVPRGVVSSIALTSGGKGYSSVPDVLVVGNGGKDATASCTISGKITSLTVNPISGGGYGYKSKYPPFVKFTGGLDPTCGVSATATATCGGGIITGISLTSAGSGYRSTPSVSFVSPMTATAIAEINEDGEIIAAKIINRGAYYAATPEVVIGGNGSGGKISAVMANGSVSKLTVDDKGKGYGYAPPLGFTYDQSGADAVASCSLEYTVKSVGVTSSGSGFITAAPPKVLFVGGGGTGAAATASVSVAGSGASATSHISGSVVYVEVTSQGSGYEFSPKVAAVASKADTLASVAELQSRILGKVTAISITDSGTGYTDGTNGTCQPMSHPRARLISAGYVQSSTPVEFSVGSSGSLIACTKIPPDEFYIQKPSVVFWDSLGVQAPTLMDYSSIGFDRIGSEGSGSVRSTPSNSDGLGIFSGPLKQVVGSSAYDPVPTHRKMAVPPTVVFPDECTVTATASPDGDTSTDLWKVKLTGKGAGYFSDNTSKDGEYSAHILLRGGLAKSAIDPPTATATVDPVTRRVLSVTMNSQGGGITNGGIVAYLSGGGGSGATVKCATKGDLVDVTLLSGGDGYTEPPTVTFVCEAPEYEDLSLGSTRQLICVDSGEARMEFAQPSDEDLLYRSPPIETTMVRPTKPTQHEHSGHLFYRNGRVLSLSIVAPMAELYLPEYSKDALSHPDGFSRKSKTDPAITITVASGTAPTATAKSVRWLPQQSGGVAIRDVSEGDFD